MSESAIQEQIRVIQRATENALKSKESALSFLIEAGIIKPSSEKPVKKKEKK